MERRLTRDELIELVRKIVAVEGTEDEISEWLTLLEENVPHPAVSDLIFWPEPLDRVVTPEEVVDEALAYRATPRGPGSE